MADEAGALGTAFQRDTFAGNVEIDCGVGWTCGVGEAKGERADGFEVQGWMIQ